jgi:hypothetical protein
MEFLSHEPSVKEGDKTYLLIMLGTSSFGVSMPLPGETTTTMSKKKNVKEMQAEALYVKNSQEQEHVSLSSCEKGQPPPICGRTHTHTHTNGQKKRTEKRN